MRAGALTTAIAVLLLAGIPGAASQVPTNTLVTVSSATSPDGTSIHLTAWSTPDASEENRVPIIVMPASWGFTENMYEIRARIIADLGFVVVGYTPRGFGHSGGQIEVASANDVADLGAVIEWAGNNTYGDAYNVGAMSVSYGSGIASLASCTNERIKAVVHMSGWGNFGDALYGDLTQHSQAVTTLLQIASPIGHQGEVVDDLLQSFDTADTEAINTFSWPRSPISCVDEINRRKVPHLLSAGWRDSIFPPNQYMEFYDAITAPKRFELAYGDHATDAIPGLVGEVPGDIWEHSQEWMNAYLKNNESSWIRSADPVLYKISADADAESGASFAALAPNSQVFGFSGSSLVSADDDSVAATSDGSNMQWSSEFSVDGVAGADSGYTEVSNLVVLNLDVPMHVYFPGLDTRYGIVLQSGSLPQGMQIRGHARLEANVGSSAGQGTFVAYLYDVGAFGNADLIHHAPYTFYHGSNDTGTYPVALDLYVALYDIPAGNSLGLVIQPSDQRYTSHNPSGATLTFQGTLESPIRLTVPTK